jgi:hypothetical protein
MIKVDRSKGIVIKNASLIYRRFCTNAERMAAAPPVQTGTCDPAALPESNNIEMLDA